MSAQREKEETSLLKTVKVKAGRGGSGSLPEGPTGESQSQHFLMIK